MALDSLFKPSTTLKQFQNDVQQVTKEGFHFKPFKRIVDGKVTIRPAITYKKGSLRAFGDTDGNKDHRIYIEKQWTF